MTNDLTFEDFYKKVGFSEYPFSTWSAEQEHDRQADLFIRPSYYGPISEKFAGGAGMFLVGERGTGKTAAIYDLTRTAATSNLVVTVDRFSEIPTGYSPSDLYKLLISRVCDELFGQIFSNRRLLNKITRSERLLLSYVYQSFTSQTTKAELTRRLEEIQSPGWKRLVYKIYAPLRIVLNMGATAGSNVLAHNFAQLLGSPPPESIESATKEFFPDLPYRSDNTFNSLECSLILLERLAALVVRLQLGRIVVIIDKLDEDSRLEGDADRIADFVRGVVTETSLHLSKNVQLIASIWSVPFSMLVKQENVRTQKMNVETLTWDRSDLVKALNNRLGVFSNERLGDYEKIFAEDVNSSDIEQLLSLCNKNPRDLWHVLDAVLRSQFKLDSTATKISQNALQEGLKDFVVRFNYYEYYPRRAGARANSMDVYAYIRHLLRLSTPEFSRNQLTERSGVSGGSASNYVNAMENMGLISSHGQTAGNVNYLIRDPKIRFALEHGLHISQQA